MEIIIFYVLLSFSFLLVECTTTKRCLPPVPPLNGSYKENRKEYIPKDEIKYFCKNGTYLYGSNIRRCLSDGTWNGTSPYCASTFVRYIFNEAGKAVLNLTDRNYSTCVLYNGSINLTFHYDGKRNAGVVLRLVWEDTKENKVLKYVKEKGRMLKVKDKYTKDSFTSVEYNWFLDTNKDYSFEISSTASNFKKSTTKLCEVEIFTEREEECPELVVRNGEVRYDPVRSIPAYGSAAVITCKEGYKVYGKHISYCSDGGQWTENNSSCEEVQCEKLAEVKNGKVEFNNPNYKGVSKLHCDEGYIPIANTEVTCQSDGKWAEHNFTCNLIDCGKLFDVTNGNISYSNTTLYGVATLRCNQGYHIINEENSTCLNNASWSHADFKCKQTLCSNFPKPKRGMKWSHGKENLDNATVGTRSSLRCLPGYTKTIEQLYIECLPSGKWSAINVTCKRATLKREYIVIAASVGAVSSAFVFACCFICSVLLKRRLKRREQTDARLPLNEIVERKVSMERHEYSVVVYEEVQDIRKKKPTSPLPKIPSGEDEFNYSFPIDQKKESCKYSGSDIYVVPEDTYKTECSSVQTRTGLKRRNSSADSTYWRKDGEYLGDICSLDIPKTRKLGSNTSLPDFPAYAFNLHDNDLYSSD